MKKNHEEIATLIPWYANSTLKDEERAAVEAHIGQCSDCRALLDEARLLMTEGLETERMIAGFEAAGGVGPAGAAGKSGTFEAHPQAQILREYADDSTLLGGETRAAVRTHLAGCEPCRTAVEAATAAGEAASAQEAAPAGDAASVPQAAPAPGRDRPVVSPLHAPPGRRAAEPPAGLWAWLSGTLLQPAPAAAYLLLLLIALPMVVLREPSTTSSGPPPGARDGAPAAGPGAPGILPPPLTITGERIFRQRRDEGAAPLDIDLPQEPGAMVQLALKTRIDREDLDDPGAAFEVEIARHGKAIWSTTTGGAGFSEDRDLRLLLPADLLRGDTATIVIRLVKPGDPLHDAELFRRTIVAR